jgi:hypothetical protein
MRFKSYQSLDALLSVLPSLQLWGAATAVESDIKAEELEAGIRVAISQRVAIPTSCEWAAFTVCALSLLEVDLA